MGKQFSFKELGDSLILRYVDEGQEFKYGIRIQELPETRDRDKSEWIMQLLDKTWVEKEMLYGLAEKIQAYEPQNKINWNRTFAIVESKYLHDEENAKLEASSSKDLKFIEIVKLNQSRAGLQDFESEWKRRREENFRLFNLNK